MGLLADTMRSTYGIVIAPEKEKMVEDYLASVIKMNEKLNLTRIVHEQEARILHLEDSLTALPLVEDALPGRYADLGTGGGFPGIPLAITSERPTLLVDSVSKKIAAVKAMVSDLAWDSDIAYYAGRIEDLAREERNGFAVITARAVTKLVSLIELASPLLCVGGRLICYKASLGKDEVSSAQAIQKLVGMKLVASKEFSLSNGDPRTLVVFERRGSASVKLPRRVGLAQHNPLA